MNKNEIVKQAAIAVTAKCAFEKNAVASYVVSGSKVQGIGLRKLVHELMDAHNVTGLATNDPNTGDVYLDFEHTNPNSFSRKIVELIEKKKGVKIDLQPREERTKFYNVNLSPEKLNEMRLAHFKRYLRSSIFDPNDSTLVPYDKHVDNVASRYRLSQDAGYLKGRVPLQARNQLLLKEMPYEFMSDDKLVRSEQDVADLYTTALEKELQL